MNAPHVYCAEVIGRAETQGSKRNFKSKTGKIISIEDNPRSRSYRQELIISMLNDRPDDPFDEAVAVSLIIYVSRPSVHYRSDGRLKPTAPRFPKSGKDIDKVQRLVGDAAKNAQWVKDDARIAEWRGGLGHGPRRLYTAERNEPERVLVTMISLEQEAAYEEEQDNLTAKEKLLTEGPLFEYATAEA